MENEEGKSNDFYVVLGLKKECTASELRNETCAEMAPDCCSPEMNFGKNNLEGTSGSDANFQSFCFGTGGTPTRCQKGEGVREVWGDAGRRREGEWGRRGRGDWEPKRAVSFKPKMNRFIFHLGTVCVAVTYAACIQHF
ncbi:hypothetical protein F2P56_026007 [Juglans regia]|uniref:Uncharacterized protein n=1 Tax=Juglans regia TaxID=51240 RepID=A0A833X3Q4_JUGRE|nr:hypothetical protein F2P56_026007 [Juglans regia]